MRQLAPVVRGKVIHFNSETGIGFIQTRAKNVPGLSPPEQVKLQRGVAQGGKIDLFVQVNHRDIVRNGTRQRILREGDWVTFTPRVEGGCAHAYNVQVEKP